MLASFGGIQCRLQIYCGAWLDPRHLEEKWLAPACNVDLVVEHSEGVFELAYYRSRQFISSVRGLGKI